MSEYGVELCESSGCYETKLVQADHGGWHCQRHIRDENEKVRICEPHRMFDCSVCMCAGHGAYDCSPCMREAIELEAARKAKAEADAKALAEGEMK